jgi:colanic acid/amylovoran biosynthesis protein
MTPGVGFGDAFAVTTILWLETLATAQRLGKTTALMGLGFGSTKNEELLATARKVIPNADLVAIREHRATHGFLRSLGVPDERMIVTGDDAIEIAYNARPEVLGSALGVNLRWTSYAGTTAAHIDAVRSALAAASHELKTELVPIPISFCRANGDRSDLEAAQCLLGDSRLELTRWRQPVTLHQVIEQVARCRVVVVGSYHAAVFAIAQGIPAVALANSQYYFDKFLGLADQFGAGCEVVSLEDTHLKERLLAGLNQAWESADELRPLLLQAANRQIQLGHGAYERLCSMVTRRTGIESVSA